MDIPKDRPPQQSQLTPTPVRKQESQRRKTVNLSDLNLEDLKSKLTDVVEKTLPGTGAILREKPSLTSAHDIQPEDQPPPEVRQLKDGLFSEFLWIKQDRLTPEMTSDTFQKLNEKLRKDEAMALARTQYKVHNLLQSLYKLRKEVTTTEDKQSIDRLINEKIGGLVIKSELTRRTKKFDLSAFHNLTNDQKMSAIRYCLGEQVVQRVHESAAKTILPSSEEPLSKKQKDRKEEFEKLEQASQNPELVDKKTSKNSIYRLIKFCKELEADTTIVSNFIDKVKKQYIDKGSVFDFNKLEAYKDILDKREIQTILSYMTNNPSVISKPDWKNILKINLGVALDPKSKTAEWFRWINEQTFDELEKKIIKKKIKEIVIDGNIEKFNLRNFKIRIANFSPHQIANFLDYCSAAPDLISDPNFHFDPEFYNKSIQELYGAQWKAMQDSPLDLKSVHLVSKQVNVNDPGSDYKQTSEDDVYKENISVGTSKSSSIGTLHNYNLTEEQKTKKGKGQTFCDTIASFQFQDKNQKIIHLLVDADGNSWGDRSRVASQKATQGVQKFIEKRLADPAKTPKSVGDMAKLLHLAAQAAHREAFPANTPSEDIWNLGTTTLFIGIQFEGHVLTESIGDSQGMLATPKKIQQFQPNAFAIDPRNPGGSIGPKTFLTDTNGKRVGNEIDAADLTNLTCFHQSIDSGEDFLITWGSDGVWDNLSPHERHLLPKDCGFPEGASWEELDQNIYNDVIEHFKMRRLVELLIEMRYANKKLTAENIRDYVLTKIDSQTEEFKKINGSDSLNQENLLMLMDTIQKKYLGKHDHVSLGLLLAGEEISDAMLDNYILKINEEGLKLNPQSNKLMQQHFPQYSYPILERESYKQTFITAEISKLIFQGKSNVEIKDAMNFFNIEVDDASIQKKRAFLIKDLISDTIIFMKSEKKSPAEIKEEINITYKKDLSDDTINALYKTTAEVRNLITSMGKENKDISSIQAAANESMQAYRNKLQIKARYEGLSAEETSALLKFLQE